MRTGLVIFLLLLSFGSPAQPLKPIDYDSLFQRRVRGLSPVQQLVWASQYATFLSNHSRFTEARAVYISSLDVAKKAHLTTLTAYFYYKLGDTEATNGNHIGTIDYYLNALSLYQTIHAYDRQAALCRHVSMQYNLLQNPVKSQQYARQATALEQTHLQLKTLAFRFNQQASDSEQAGQLDAALAYVRKAMNIFWITRQWTDFYSFLDYQGYLLTTAGRYREAEQIFRQCLTYSIQQGDRRREMYEYMHLPEPLLHQGQFDEAEYYAKLALSRIEHDSERQDEHRTEVYASLAHIAEARGQYKQALTYERLSDQYRNVMQSVEKNRQIAEVEARYQTAQKQARINQLDEENRRQLTQITWQAAGLLALLVLAGWQYRVIRRVNARLKASSEAVSENNRQISQQADRLGVLMQELHHRVKNNLAIVSSLLRMQSKRLDDPRAIQAVQDGQRRVEAISLIHQQFYQTENLADVPVKAYITELTEGLLLGYGFDPDSFECRVEVADINLDVDVAVPLGLILNEVLTNAFKYAYNNVAKPRLSVRLQPVTDGPATGLLIEVQDNGPGLEGPGLDWPGRTDARLASSSPTPARKKALLASD